MARLVVVSNRVTVPNRNESDRAGGLAVVIRQVLKRHSGIWFGWSGKVTKSEASVYAIERGNQSYILTDLTKEDYDEYYNGFANRVLWPVFHYRLDIAEFSRRDLIPSLIDQNPCAHWRKPMAMMRQGCSTSLFHASQQ
jgi:trehalose 6-phosphate synthase